MPVELTSRTRVVASRNHVSTTVSGEAVILGMDDGVYYGLDPVGTRVWELVKEPRSLGEVTDAIVAEFDVTPERALADLIVLATDLAGRGLIEVAPVQPTS